MDGEHVLEKLCEEKHKNIGEKFVIIDKRLDTHADKIDTMEKANIKLTQILERLSNPEEKENNKLNFWNTKAGQVIPYCILIIIIFGICALVGTNLIEALKTLQNIVP